MLLLNAKLKKVILYLCEIEWVYLVVVLPSERDRLDRPQISALAQQEAHAGAVGQAEAAAALAGN